MQAMMVRILMIPLRTMYLLYLRNNLCFLHLNNISNCLLFYPIALNTLSHITKQWNSLKRNQKTLKWKTNNKVKKANKSYKFQIQPLPLYKERRERKRKPLNTCKLRRRWKARSKEILARRILTKSNLMKVL